MLEMATFGYISDVSEGVSEVQKVCLVMIEQSNLHQQATSVGQCCGLGTVAIWISVQLSSTQVQFQVNTLLTNIKRLNL